MRPDFNIIGPHSQLTNLILDLLCWLGVVVALVLVLPMALYWRVRDILRVSWINISDLGPNGENDGSKVYSFTRWIEVSPVPNTLPSVSRPWYIVLNSFILDLLKACQSFRSISATATVKERKPKREVSNFQKWNLSSYTAHQLQVNWQLLKSYLG